MPQAPQWLRDKWPGGDDEAIAFLERRGWTLTQQWEWIKPTPQHIETQREGWAIAYLIHEWDFGGILETVQ